ncbi:anti-repressor SinI family protein [Virgibacillus xinjiangensis]|uniref:Anti-repressor SinI family protein n=1 Tax=Virgibacillus xinjiangensis TaxID=393090 RepID=A0ABV7CYC2_9BACI
MEKVMEDTAIDQEWLELIKEAKLQGLSTDQFRAFLQQAEREN